MAKHVAYIHTRTPGPVKVAVCACGWESNPHATAIGAIKERDQHVKSCVCCDVPLFFGNTGESGHGRCKACDDFFGSIVED